MLTSLAQRLLTAMPELVRVHDPARAFAALCDIANREQRAYNLRLLGPNESPGKGGFALVASDKLSVRVAVEPGPDPPSEEVFDALKNAFETLAGAAASRVRPAPPTQALPSTGWLSRREQYLAALTEVQRRLLAFTGDGPC